jgi:uncharacterized protein
MNHALKQQLIDLLLPYKPAKIGIFGSFARGESHAGSDLDVLVRFQERISLLKLVEIEQELSDRLGMPVDLVTEKSLKHPKVKQSIQADLIPIFG